MIYTSKSTRWFQVVIVCICFFIINIIFISPSLAKTYVSGTVSTADGKVVASGAVALEKGELHNNAFLAGGAIGPDGHFKIPLPVGGSWGLHVYSEKYIYFPLQIQITAGIDNETPVILPVDGNPGDDPKISDIRFTRISDQVFQISIEVDDPNKNLGPQMLAIDTKRFKSYRLVPQKGDLKDKKAVFPTGKYVSAYIPKALGKENLKDWLFVAADHQCSNGAIFNGLGQSIYKPARVNSEPLACEVKGIWKSNFGKIYKFAKTPAGTLKGKQFEGKLKIEKIEKRGDKIVIAFRFEGKKGSAELKLSCRKRAVILEGTFQYPGKTSEWIFTKLRNAPAALSGKTLFSSNCSGCHFHDRKDKRVGPGLLGLFSNPALTESGLPVTEQNVLQQITDGGDRMPPFKHLKKDEVKAIVDYLKTL